jgi:hypothetical protein
VLSGRLLAEAILQGAPASYPQRLRAHPLLVDYRRVFRLREVASALRRPAHTTGQSVPFGALGRIARLEAVSRTSRRAIVRGFAWMFSGARLPAPGLIDLALAVADRWQGKGPSRGSGQGPDQDHGFHDGRAS